MSKKKRYSLASISAELGVSKASVSLVLNNKARSGGISEELEKRILDFCRKVNYMPNIHAQRINSREVKNIGILVNVQNGGDEVTPFGEYNISHVIGGIAAAADQAGYRFTAQLYKPGMNENRAFDWFKTREIGGLIYYGFDMPEPWRDTFVTEKYPVVGVSSCPDYGLPSVNVNNFDASFKLTEYLITKKGHRKFLYIDGPAKSYPGVQRYKGFRHALDTHGFNFSENSLLHGEFDCNVAEELIRQRWITGELVEDAIVCANDNMAIGVIKALNDAGISIPEQVAVAGADNIKTGRYITPPLTSFNYLPYEQGREAFKLLLSIIKGNNETAHVTLNTSLCFRTSA